MALHALDERDQGVRVCCFLADGEPYDVFRIHPVLKVIRRLQLAVEHVVLLHPHKGGIRVCLGIAVAVPAYVDMFCVLLQLSDIRLQQLDVFLQLTFPLPDSTHEGDPFFFLKLIQLLPKLFQLMECDGAVMDDLYGMDLLTLLDQRDSLFHQLRLVLRH